jgi:hypothetical protein
MQCTRQAFGQKLGVHDADALDRMQIDMAWHIAEQAEVGRGAEYDVQAGERADDLAAAPLQPPPALQRRVLVGAGQHDGRARHNAEFGAHLLVR